MTYISRKTRIIVSRWSDECDAEYWLKASRKRSDGRLKKHNSCDDLRAWTTNECIHHEYLVDLMSDGEAGKESSNLYGRFIPVPVLFKILQNDLEIGGTESNGQQSYSQQSNGQKLNSQQSKGQQSKRVTVGGKNVRYGGKKNNDITSGSDSSLTVVQCEKFLLEKRLLKCIGLLSRALGKLEKIDTIVYQAECETESSRNQEIQEAFSQSKENCCCSGSSQTARNSSGFSSNSYVKKIKESVKCKELLRKISGLREKLKKIQEYRQEINEQIRSSQQRLVNCSSLQITELYSRREQACLKRLQKKLERLIAEKGKLLSEMCQALECLTKLKKCSKSSLSFRKKSSRTSRNKEEFQSGDLGVQTKCGCGCQSSENCNSSESEKVECYTSSSIESFTNETFDKSGRADYNFDYDPRMESHQNSSAENSTTYKKMDLGRHYEEENEKSSKYINETRQSAPKVNKTQNSSATEYSKFQSSKNSQKTLEAGDEKNDQNKTSKQAKKSKLKFVCPQPDCKKKNQENLAAFQNFINSQAGSFLQGPNSFNMSRPSTSPTTKTEKFEKSMNKGSRNPMGGIPGRRTKSETTMKDIEKTLRNYEERLDSFDSLEYKVEELKQKLLDADRMRKRLTKQKAEGKKLRAADREISNREITKLCSENWELKKQVQQLTSKFESQCKKIVSLKGSAKKVRDLECETEELKKELAEYRDNFEHQRKCITKWESVVAVQRTEIEKLMNRIRTLTTKESANQNICPERKNAQRSRSYSPESIKIRGMPKPKTATRGYRMPGEDEEVICCCDDFRQEKPKRNTMRGYERNYGFQPQNRRVDWSMN